jgi:hypothetical protein
MIWILTLVLGVYMASGNNGRRAYGNGGVNPKTFFNRPGFPIDPGGVAPPKPVEYDPGGVIPPKASPYDAGGVNPKTLFGGPIDPGGVVPLKPQPIDPGGINPKRPWWMAMNNNLY